MHMCYIPVVSTIGVRELRQHASEVLRSVEAGEAATVTVAGRPVAQIIPIRADQWTTWDLVKQVFDGPTDLEWNAERAQYGGADLRDPWEG